LVFEGENTSKRVVIPHYGGAFGVATAFYKTTFNMNSFHADEAVFIIFKGVDYKANIFINHAFVGLHEGFFAPFEFDITKYIIDGENTLTVRVENDHTFGGNASEKSPIRYEGDKLYAATGLGYDDPQFGWHHCLLGWVFIIVYM
jgi:hypothetical protein